MRKIVFSILILTALVACNQDSATTNPGYVALGLTKAQDFNPNVVHGEISQYKVTITGQGLTSPIVKYFPADATEASFDGFADGSQIEIMVEYINVNGLVVRRGRSGLVAIRGGETTAAPVTVNNVPIFANVRDGATVVSSRFVPTVFAPGGITFAVSDDSNGVVANLTDAETGLASLSVSVDDPSSVMPFHISDLSPGSHQLTVMDPQTAESSTITVTVLPGVDRQALTTTGGGFSNSLLAGTGSIGFNLIVYDQRLAGH